MNSNPYIGSSISTGAPLNLQSRLDELKANQRVIRRKLAFDVLTSIISNPAYVKADETEVAKQAVAYTDALLNVLEVTESVTDKLNGTT